MTAPATKILNRWFESEPLISTLATDAVIGAMVSPSTPGSGYVLMHHCMGEVNGERGVWYYVKGGMGAVSNAIAAAAKKAGAQIEVDLPVQSILVKNGKAAGVVLKDGSEIPSKVVLSNVDPYTTFMNFIDSRDFTLHSNFVQEVKSIDFNSATFKINLAVDRLPNFKAIPNQSNEPGPQHRGTIHLTHNLQEIEDAYQDALLGKPSK